MKASSLVSPHPFSLFPLFSFFIVEILNSFHYYTALPPPHTQTLTQKGIYMKFNHP